MKVFRKILTVVLLGFAGLSAAVFCYRLVRPAAPAAAPADKGLVVYYLHRSERCPACNRIEQLTRQAVEEGFAGQLSDGTLTFRVLESDRPPGQALGELFGLDTNMVVLAEWRDGACVRFVKLPRVWDLYDQPEEFVRYVREGVAQFTGISTGRPTPMSARDEGIGTNGREPQRGAQKLAGGEAKRNPRNRVNQASPGGATEVLADGFCRPSGAQYIGMLDRGLRYAPPPAIFCASLRDSKRFRFRPYGRPHGRASDLGFVVGFGEGLTC